MPKNTVYAYEEPVAGMALSLEAHYQRAVKETEKIENSIEKYSEIYSVDSDLVRAIMSGESDGDIKAYNLNDDGTHDSGLMQINSGNYEWLINELGITDFYDPKQNIHCGVFMIADIMKNHSDIHEILMCYNMGWKRTRELHSEGIYSSHYSRGVVEKLNKIKGGNRS